MAHPDLTIRTLRAVDQALRRKLVLDVNAGIITFHVLGLAGVLSPMGQNGVLGIILEAENYPQYAKMHYWG